MTDRTPETDGFEVLALAKPSARKCPECGEATSPRYFEAIGRWLPVTYCSEACLVEHDRRTMQAEHDAKIDDVLDRAGFFPAEVRRARRLRDEVILPDELRELGWRADIDEPAWRHVWAPTGSGKTTRLILWLVDVLEEALCHGLDLPTVRYVRERVLMDTLKPYGDGLDLYAACDILLLDNCGEGRGAECELGWMTALVDTRNRAWRCTVTASEHPLSYLVKGGGTLGSKGAPLWHEQMASRLVEMALGNPSVALPARNWRLAARGGER